MANFKLPPISPLAGSGFRNYIKALRQGRVEYKYILTTIITGLIILIGTPFRWYERVIFKPWIKRFQFAEPPLFVLGHWRGGTTVLHNLLCQDPSAGYLTTYHSLFPHYLASKWLFKTFMRIVMPKKRPGDNVELSVDLPQEEEFCIGNLNPWSYYYYLYFPENYQTFYEKYVRFTGVTQELRNTWVQDYRNLVIKATINSNGERAVFKNPINTARIRELLDAFPNARFIHIYRNPVVVYLSNLKFFSELHPTLNFQKVTQSEIKEIILATYVKVFEDFESTKNLIPSQNFLEFKFEDFESNPMKHLKQIYNSFNLPDFDMIRPLFESYLESKRSYQKNVYTIRKEELDEVMSRWGFAMTKWDYPIPKNLEIIQ